MITTKYVVDTVTSTKVRAIPGRDAAKTLSITLQPYVEGQPPGMMAGMPLQQTITNPTDADEAAWVEGAIVTVVATVDEAKS